MAGLFAHIGASALEGVGKGIMIEAENKRKAALEKLSMDQRASERSEDRSIRETERTQDRAERDLRAEQGSAEREKDRANNYAMRGLGRGGRGGGGGENKLSAGLEVSLSKQFKDDAGETDWGLVNDFQDEVLRLMDEEDLNETSAKRKAMQGMVFEDETRTGGPSLFNPFTWLDDEVVTTTENRDHKGTFKGFQYGKDAGPSQGLGVGAPSKASIYGSDEDVTAPGPVAPRSPDVEQMGIPSEAIAMLKADPSKAAQFDEIFGAGAAERVLSK